MDILITNDDGIYADGLWALYRQFHRHHAVTVIAPEGERSAVGHAITLKDPIRVTAVTVNGGYRGYAVSGTPADCVKIGVLELMPSRPQLVVAGINAGANVGINLNYSGTVAAAREAALYGLAAIAVSVQGPGHGRFDQIAGFIADLAETVNARGLPPGTCLNVNWPAVGAQQISGVRFSRQCIGRVAEYFDKRIDPRDQTYYWQGVESQRVDAEGDVDVAALQRDFISITPVKCDMTDYDTLERLKTWPIDSSINWPCRRPSPDDGKRGPGRRE